MTYRRRFLAGALAVATLTAACSSSAGGHKTGDPTSTPPASSSTSTSSTSSTPSSSPSTTDPAIVQLQTEQTIQAAWLNYWKVSLALTTHPRAEWAERVNAIAVDPIYSELLNSVRVQQDKLGEVGFGYVISHPYWPTPPTAATKTVVMGDCFDGSHAGTKLTSTGKIKTVGKTHTNIHATLVNGAAGMWRVHQIQYLKTSC